MSDDKDIDLDKRIGELEAAGDRASLKTARDLKSQRMAEILLAPRNPTSGRPLEKPST